MQPYVGQIVLYVTRPGQAHAGQNELAAIVTRVLPSRAVSTERPQEFKRLIKERKPGEDGNMKEVTREVTEIRMVPDTSIAPPSVDLRIFIPDRADPLIQQSVMAASDRVTGHCWKPVNGFGRVEVHLDETEKAQMRADIAKLSEQVVELAELITAPAPKKAASAR